MNKGPAGNKTIPVKIRRQERPGAPAHYEEFAVPYKPNMTVIALLMEIQRNPVTAGGRHTTPVVWESSCLEEICGSCAMRINGRARPACSSLVDKLDWPITLEPFKSFPVIRDLIVDRGIMFEHLKEVKAWVPIDGTHAIGPGPRVAPDDQAWMYELSKCFTCGCCLEACPQFNANSSFIGPAAISQVRLFNGHPIGKMHAVERLEALMGPGGVTDCANNQNCVQVCPKGIPLTTSLAVIKRDTTWHAFRRWMAR